MQSFFHHAIAAKSFNLFHIIWRRLIYIKGNLILLHGGMRESCNRGKKSGIIPRVSGLEHPIFTPFG